MKNKKKAIEEIGRSFKTIDPTPIDFFHDPRIEVEIFPAYNEKYAASITVPALNLTTDLRTFDTEEEATLWARNTYTHYLSQVNALEESVYARLYSILLCE